MSFNRAGLDLYLLGDTFADLAGSEWAFLHGERIGQAPTADLSREIRLIELLLAGHSAKIFSAAHDLSQGGLSAGLTEMVLRHSIGATVSLSEVGIGLLSESPGRVIVAIQPDNCEAIARLGVNHAITVTKLGTTGGDSLIINDCVIPLDDLRIAHTSTFPRLFG
jgi:phosphoribosylformylglycinamidine synthase